MEGMDSIINYQEGSCKMFKPHSPLTAKQSELLDWALGLPGETGEVCELLKHHVFHNEPLDKMKIAKELGDVLWYLNAVATTLNICFMDITSLNLAKLQHRYAGTQYNDELSARRHSTEEKFEDTEEYKRIKAAILCDYKDLIKGKLNIVIVGPDGSGKTTLAKALAAALGFEYYKGSIVDDNKLEKAKQCIASEVNTVYDRFYYPDEVIYRSVLKDPLPEGELIEFNNLTQDMVMNNFIFLHVTAEHSILKSRMSSRGDEFINVTDLATIEKEYDKFFKATSILSARVDTSNISPNLLLHQCLSLMQGIDTHFRNSVQVEGEFVDLEEEEDFAEVDAFEDLEEYGEITEGEDE